MRFASLISCGGARTGAARFIGLALAAVALAPVACVRSSSSTTTSVGSVAPVAAPPAGQAVDAAAALPPPLTPELARAPSPDPRVGLRGGFLDAESASWNMRLVSSTPPSEPFIRHDSVGLSRIKSSDLAFAGNLVIQGNYSGWQIWDVTNPRRPVVRTAYVCPGAQSDVSVYRNLLFVSHEATSGRIDCGIQGLSESVSADRARGVRIYDISDISNPRRVAMVQTCRGSHTHTLVTDPNDRENVYIYVSGSAAVRSPEELPGCSTGPVSLNPNTAQFRLEVIQVPLANPGAARIVSSPRVFSDLTAPPSRAGGGRGGAGAAGGGRGGRGAGGAGAGAAGAAGGGAGAAAGAGGVAGAAAGRAGAAGRGGGDGGPSQCHDITVYPAIGLAGGACGGYGLLLDIRDVRNPVRIGAVADSNMSFWHSATFNNDGTKLLFSDEWGGGTAARCRVTDRLEWGADAIFTLENNRLTFRSYYKMPAAQTDEENCVAHNGSLIPIPGRDIMVQSWYQGGISVFDWTDADNPMEIAYFDRGPIDSTRLIAAGHWSAYWYNGYIFGSAEFRGLDIFQLAPSPFLSQNEIDAASTVRFEQFNPQEQPRIVWPPSFPLARAYLDQLARGNGISRESAVAIARELAIAERRAGEQRRATLLALAERLDGDAPRAADQAKFRLLASAVRDLASTRQ